MLLIELLEEIGSRDRTPEFVRWASQVGLRPNTDAYNILRRWYTNGILTIPLFQTFAGRHTLPTSLVKVADRAADVIGGSEGNEILKAANLKPRFEDETPVSGVGETFRVLYNYDEGEYYILAGGKEYDDSYRSAPKSRKYYIVYSPEPMHVDQIVTLSPSQILRMAKIEINVVNGKASVNQLTKDSEAAATLRSYISRGGMRSIMKLVKRPDGKTAIRVVA